MVTEAIFDIRHGVTAVPVKDEENAMVLAASFVGSRA